MVFCYGSADFFAKAFTNRISLTFPVRIPDIIISGMLIPYHFHRFIIHGSRPFSKTPMPYLFHRFPLRNFV